MSADNERIYPCAIPGCKVMRSKDEGGTVFTVCDKHWDAAVAARKKAEARQAARDARALKLSSRQ